MSEYDNELKFVFMDMKTKLKALLINKTVYVNSNYDFEDVIEYVAEEIGHYETLGEGVDISDYRIINNRKWELIGREWGYKKLVPIEKLKEFVSNHEVVYDYDLAEEFGVSEHFIEETVEMYKRKGAI